MASNMNHPYIPSPGPLVQAITQFRSMFPAKVDADTLKRLSIAPNNESMVLRTLQYLGLIDKDNQRQKLAQQLFSVHDDNKFQKQLEMVIKDAYEDLFQHFGDKAWELDRNTLIGFFRASDETSAITGQRQAFAFETLAALSGHGEVSAPKQSSSSPKQKKAGTKTQAAASVPKVKQPEGKGAPLAQSTPIGGGVGLTVRIEINLPAQGDQDTYDRIFKSIKENFLNG